jgi:Rrf2 family protein
MRITAKADYAVRAVAELAAVEGRRPLKADRIAQAQDIPLKFLLNILSELRHARIVQSHRGPEGGFQLARAPADITLAEVIRAVEGPLANVHDARPEELEYPGAAAPLRDVWIAVRANLRAVLEHVTVADLATDRLPARVRRLVQEPDSWVPR